MKRHLERKQFEPLHNILGVMAAELADVEDGFHQEKKCSGHAQIQSSQRTCEVNTIGENSYLIFVR